MVTFWILFNAASAAANGWAYGEYGSTLNLVVMAVNIVVATALFVMAVSGRF